MIRVANVGKAIVIIWGADSSVRDGMVTSIRAFGWSAIETNDVVALAQAGGPTPSLIVLMPSPDGDTLALHARAIRALADGLKTVPILACAVSPDLSILEQVPEIDDLIDFPSSPDALALLLEQWAPHDPLATARALANTFGEVPIGNLIAGLRFELDIALKQLDQGGDVVHAHRIAGIAGTLGFSAVSQAWLSLSERDETALSDARRTARIAIAAIDRDTLKAA